ncbi:MAG: DUF4364 family protein [Clostridia bacterium]|nr:DUF4364 family protein [Clostridia bacterium]
MYDAMPEGTEPGGLRDRSEIKILICFLIDKLDFELTAADIGEFAVKSGCANFFEVMGAAKELIDNDRIIENANGSLNLTEKGQRAASILYKELPLTVRESILNVALKDLTYRQNERENPVKITQNEDGYEVSISLINKDEKMMEIKFYVSNLDTAENIKNNFLKDPIKIYSELFSSLLSE